MHISLPQSMTPEKLGQWLTMNAIENKQHEESFDLTEDEIRNFEHTSSVSSRAMDDLEALKDKFMSFLKDGTQEPTDVTIPPTKGLKALQANREFADAQIKLGVRVEITELYAIPCPENKKICFFDIEGNHFEQHDYRMNPGQMQKYDKPLMAEMSGKKKKEPLEGFNFKGGKGTAEDPALFETKPKPSSIPFDV